jgi:hypothetical protein
MTQPMVRIDDEGKSVWGRGLRSNPEPNSANQFKLGRGLRASPTVTPEIVARNLTTYQIWFNMAAEGRQNGMSFKSH